MSEKQALEAEITSDKKAKSTDVQENKTIAILAYIVFFLPLLASKESKFAMYHANQSLILFLGWITVTIFGTMIPIIGWFIILPFGTFLLLILWIIGIINAARGRTKPLPLIGKITILN